VGVGCTVQVELGIMEMVWLGWGVLVGKVLVVIVLQDNNKNEIINRVDIHLFIKNT
jgi:hypothetical protein